MKYIWEFKYECILKYKKGRHLDIPKYTTCSKHNFSVIVRTWVRTFDIYGIDNKSRGRTLKKEIVMKDKTKNQPKELAKSKKKKL